MNLELWGAVGGLVLCCSCSFAVRVYGGGARGGGGTSAMSAWDSCDELETG